MDLSILIPAYNEASRIVPTLDAYLNVKTPLTYEVIVVVNGSTDETAALISSRPEAQTDSLRLVEVSEAIGKGGALLRGFRESKGARIAYTDADGSTPPESLFALVEDLQDPGLVIGSRWLADSVIGTPQPPARRMASRCFNGMVRFMFHLKVSDTQCGAKVISREVMEAVLKDVGCTQWAFDVDLLFQVKRKGFPISERPVTWNDHEGSKVNLFRSSIEMTLALTRLRLMYSPLRGIVTAWDTTLGRKLFDRRMLKLKTIHGGTSIDS